MEYAESEIKKTMKNEIPPREGFEVVPHLIKVVFLSRMPKLVANRNNIVLMRIVKTITLMKKNEKIQNNVSFSMVLEWGI
jgi:hypothetical protein